MEIPMGQLLTSSEPYPRVVNVTMKPMTKAKAPATESAVRQFRRPGQSSSKSSPGRESAAGTAA